MTTNGPVGTAYAGCDNGRRKATATATVFIWPYQTGVMGMSIPPFPVLTFQGCEPHSSMSYRERGQLMNGGHTF